jgi:hypothetical protein
LPGRPRDRTIALAARRKTNNFLHDFSVPVIDKKLSQRPVDLGVLALEPPELLRNP